MILPLRDVGALPLSLARPIVCRVEARTTIVVVCLKSDAEDYPRSLGARALSWRPKDKKQEGTAVTARIGQHIDGRAIMAGKVMLGPEGYASWQNTYDEPAKPRSVFQMA